MSRTVEAALARCVLDLERQRDYWLKAAEKARTGSKSDAYRDAVIRAAELKVELNEARDEAEQEKAAREELEEALNRRDQATAELAAKYGEAIKALERVTKERDDERRDRDAISIELERLSRPASEAEKALLVQNVELIQAAHDVAGDFGDEEIKRQCASVRAVWALGRKYGGA